MTQIIRPATRPMTSVCYEISMTTTATCAGQVVDVSASVDAGLSSDAEMVASSAFISALNTALT